MTQTPHQATRPSTLPPLIKKCFLTLTILTITSTQGFAQQSKKGNTSDKTHKKQENPFIILTPQPKEEPRINGARVVGGTPGKPFLFRIPTTGKRPIQFNATNLPKGITLDAHRGILKGIVPPKGTYTVTLTAKNKKGTTESQLDIISGNTLALTPPMGWNSWYCWSESISAQKIVDTAQALVDTGLADHGWTYVNIDDCWQGERSRSNKALQGNKRFPDMKALCDTVHSHGLKIGIYSTPWISTYAGFTGGSSPSPDGIASHLYIPKDKRLQPTQFFGRYPSFVHLKLNRVGPYWFCDTDAKQWGAWGIDFVKYDWKPNDIPTTKRLLEGLQKSGRDIVLSLSNDTPFKNAQPISELSNLWRTGGDIHDQWRAILRNGFHKAQWAEFSRPGHWNDPDMLQLGMRGIPNQFVRKLTPTRLSPNEQYAHMSLWCLLSAPLILSCDIKSMDDFTLGLLTNDEVIAIDQDPLGQSAKPIDEKKEIWIKPLSNGSFALGVFNLSNQPHTIHVTWKQLGIPSETWKVRDLWRQKDLGSNTSGWTTSVEPHGVSLFSLSR